MQIYLQGDILAIYMVATHIHTLVFQCDFGIVTNILFWLDQRGEGFFELLH
jgi:hypothetical protein